MNTNHRATVDAAYRRRYNYLRYRGVPTEPVDSQPVTKHVRALNDLGWSYEAIRCMAVNVADTTIALIADGTHPTAHRSTAAAILNIPYTLAPPDTVPDECLIPTLGAQRRVRALIRLGWTHKDLAAHGLPGTCHLARATYKQTSARRWRATAAVYDQLHMTPGRSNKTIAFARKYGYQAPMAWWDIDNPKENPRLSMDNYGTVVVDRNVVARLLAGEQMVSTREEKLEAMRRWLADGKSARSLSKIHGWNDGRYVPREDVPA